MENQNTSNAELIETKRNILVPREHLMAMANAGLLVRENFELVTIESLYFQSTSEDENETETMVPVEICFSHLPENAELIDVAVMPMLLIMVGELYADEKIEAIKQKVIENENPLFAQVVNSYLDKFLNEN